MKSFKFAASLIVLVLTTLSLTVSGQQTPKLQEKRISHLGTYFSYDKDLERAVEIFERRDEDDQPGVVGELKLLYFKNGKQFATKSALAQVVKCDERYFKDSDLELKHPQIYPPAPAGAYRTTGLWALGLRSIFFPGSKSHPTRVGTEVIGGIEIIRYKYAVSRENSAYVTTERDVNPAQVWNLLMNRNSEGTGDFRGMFVTGYHGDLLVDAKRKDIIGFTLVADDISPESKTAKTTLEVFLGWGDVIGKEPVLVPVKFIATLQKRNGDSERVLGEYKKFRMPGAKEEDGESNFSPTPLVSNFGAASELSGLSFRLSTPFGNRTTLKAKPSATPLTAKQIESLLEQNTFKLETVIAGKRFIGTAFAYGHENGKTIFVTDAHAEGEITLSHPKIHGKFVAKVEKVDTSHDRMKLSILENLRTTDTVFADPDVDELVWNLGYPAGKRKLSAGKITSAYTGTTKFDSKTYGPFEGYKAVFTTHNHGQSGSVALDQWGQVVLLLSGTPEKAVGSTEPNRSFVFGDGGGSLKLWLDSIELAQKK